MTERLSQLQGHLSNTYSRGLLSGKTAIITGSGQGIGAECARLFANEGARVVVCDIDAEKSKAVADEIVKNGGQALSFPGDVQSQAYNDALVKAAADLGGDNKIHILVLMAGFTWDGVIHKMTDKQWDAMLSIHNTGPFKLVRAAAPYFRLTDKEDRSVITISSTSGVYGNAGQLNYSVAKAGVTGMAKTIAKEWGPKFGVRANTVAYGYIQTRLTEDKQTGSFAVHNGEKVALGIPGAGSADRTSGIPLARGGTATEAAGAVLALASPLMAYVSGHTLMVTGGR